MSNIAFGTTSARPSGREEATPGSAIGLAVIYGPRLPTQRGEPTCHAQGIEYVADE
jgi:hypothetical protein